MLTDLLQLSSISGLSLLVCHLLILSRLNLVQKSSILMKTSVLAKTSCLVSDHLSSTTHEQCVLGLASCQHFGARCHNRKDLVRITNFS
jgi:hypothetical protein